MQLPLAAVLRRGVVFLWPEFSALSDPALAGKTKAKFIVILSISASDDPIVFILTTSEKPKHASVPHPGDFLRIPAGTYEFFPADTLIDVSAAGEFDIGRDEFAALYEKGALIYQGRLSDGDVSTLVAMILTCPRVPRRFKQTLTS